VLLLIDTRGVPPEPEPEHDGGPGGAHWVAALLAWLFPWPAIVAWLLAGGILLDQLPGAAFAVAAVLVTFWRLAKAYPHDGGLSSHPQ
jgi:hypothetical protein